MERKIIQKEKPSPLNKLVFTCKGKKARHRNYYTLNSDNTSLEILARIRNTTVKKLLIEN